jgi:hypothetical protein
MACMQGLFNIVTNRALSGYSAYQQLHQRLGGVLIMSQLRLNVYRVRQLDHDRPVFEAKSHLPFFWYAPKSLHV